jgi:UDP-N-acetylglucosamine 1-carboxyvinyltransferase
MMQKMGVTIERKDGRYFLDWKHKVSSNIFLEETSVTATEMGLMMASSMDDGIKLDDAATEPHVSDLADLLIKMGAKISGVGKGKIVKKVANSG